MAINHEQDLAAALTANQDTIEIEGNLAAKVIKIKATGSIAWLIAIAAIGMAVVSIMAALPSGGTSLGISAFAAPAAVGILGAGTTYSAISIAVAAGGVGVLNQLRDYRIKKISDNHVILQRKA